MLTLERLKLVNFLSHRDTDLVFSSYEGLILIEGKTEDGHYTSNGAGKSTILEGVYYALTGKTFRGVSADSVVNNKVDKDMEVTLEFFIGKTPFKISRYRKHTLKGNSLEFYEGGQDRSSRLQADTQKVIDDTVNIDPNILSGVLLLGEGLSSRFTYLSDTDKKSLLESTIMTSHNILAIRDQLGVKMRDLQEKVKFLEGQIYSNTQSITESQHLLSLDKPTMEREAAAISCKIDEYTQGLSSLGEIREGLQSKKLILSQAISQVTSTQESLRRSQLEESNLITQLSTVQAPDPTCPMCHQKLPNEEGIRVRESLGLALDAVRETLYKLKDSLEKLPPFDVLALKSKDLDEQLRHTLLDSQELSQKIRDSEFSLRTITSDLSRVSQIGDTAAELTDKNAQLTLQLEVLRRDIESTDYLYKKIYASTGILVDILQSVVSYIDQRLSTYTTLLLDKSFRMSLTRGKLVLESDSGSYNALSNGEKRRLDISIQFALHDYIYMNCGIGFDTLFIDEILDTLDTVGVSNIIEVLELKRSYCSLGRVFIVTHNTDLKTYFDEVLLVSKDSEGFSTIS